MCLQYLSWCVSARAWQPLLSPTLLEGCSVTLSCLLHRHKETTCLVVQPDRGALVDLTV